MAAWYEASVTYATTATWAAGTNLTWLRNDADDGLAGVRQPLFPLLPTLGGAAQLVPPKQEAPPRSTP